MSLTATAVLKSVKPTGRRSGSVERALLISALNGFLGAGHGLAGEVIAADDLLHSLRHPGKPRTLCERSSRSAEILRLNGGPS